MPTVNAGQSGIIIVGGKSATAVGPQLLNKIQNQNRNANVFGDIVDGVESGLGEANKAIGSVLDPLLPGTSATGTAPSDPSGPLSASAGVAKPSIVETGRQPAERRRFGERFQVHSDVGVQG